LTGEENLDERKKKEIEQKFCATGKDCPSQNKCGKKEYRILKKGESTLVFMGRRIADPLREK